MIQRGRGTRLSPEAFEHLGIVGNLFGQELQRYKAADIGFFGLVDGTHPATPSFSTMR